MNELIKLKQAIVGGELAETVNARDLHEFLGSDVSFTEWIRERIRNYEFVQGVDFTIIMTNGQIGKMGDYGAEYYLSLDMGKECAMVERTARGKQARKYFIACEKRSKAQPQISGDDLKALSKEARLQFKHCMQIGKLVGLEGNQLALAANKGTRAATGIDVLGSMNVTHMTAPEQFQDLNVTELADRVGVSSAQVMNKYLCAFEYQVRYRDSKNNLYYEPTEFGKTAGGVMKDAGKSHGNGRPILQLMWSSKIIMELQQLIRGIAA